MYYFASDVHLGLDGLSSSLEREKTFVRWLEEVSADAKVIFLAGDIFDFWFEWKRVIPKGFSRTLGKMSELTDRGIEIHFFVGNHDMWAYDYLHTECGLTLHDRPEIFELYGKQVFIAHGDNMYLKRPSLPERFMNWAFKSKVMRRLGALLVPPGQMVRFGRWWSEKSRKTKNVSHVFRGENEYLVKYARQYCKAVPVDYFVFGHIHCAEVYELGDGCTAFFLGEWIVSPAYAVLRPDGTMELHGYGCGCTEGETKEEK